MDEFYMNEALKQAKAALKKGEVPIGAIIVKNEVIISRGFNKKEKTKDGTAHAEIIAIKNACKKLNDWRLTDCTMYVTLEPCLMCVGAAIETRIKRIVYGTENNNKGYDNVDGIKIEMAGLVLKQRSEKILKVFFEGIR